MKIRNKHKIITFIVASAICLIVIYLHLFSHDKTQKIYLEQTEKMVIDIKKDFLKDTVNNMFLEIDWLRKTKYDNYVKNTESRLRRFEEDLNVTDEEFIKSFTDKFNDDLNSKMWTAFLWDNSTEEIIYATPDLYMENIENTVESLKLSLSSYAVVKKDNIEGVFGVSKSYIDELVKEEIGNTIKSRKFSNGSYMWINEIINYEGGKDYAIRRVHPNLKDTEGVYLSTDMEDIKGNLPYLEELEGINEKGELFFSYYFKKLNKEEVSEKVTYAKLYEDYEWIIAMGVHLDDIDAYAEEINKEVYSLSTETIRLLLKYIFIVLLVGFIMLYLIEKNHLSTSTRFLQKQINFDTLTKAYSRRFGEKYLNELFKEYLLIDKKVAIIMFDIDDFKNINDKYGHKVGDMVLIEVVETINSIIKSSDKLVRWGGEEFLIILPGLSENHIREFGRRLLNEISSLEIPLESNRITTTISMGCSYFKDTDIDYNNVLKRVDDAMYKSKEQGKNRINILL